MQVVFIVLAALFLQQEHRNLSHGQLALQGYDPVSYFTGKALKGSDKITTDSEGAVYFFSSEANRKAFLNNPHEYEPQYGGWCAYALGKKPEKVKVDPETFKIVNGKLYLFYNFWGTNTLKYWNEDEASLLQRADTHWQSILSGDSESK